MELSGVSSQKYHETKVKVVQDVIYGQIQIEPYIMDIVNTVEFQRLRRLRQNGNAFMVYPSCNQLRFEHSLGVYHLTRKLIEQLSTQLPSLTDEEQERFVEATKLVKVAAVCHDIGHGPFSHLFERTMFHLNHQVDHEELSALIVQHVLGRLGYDARQIGVVCALIQGHSVNDPLFEKFVFLQMIVSNSVSSLDTDKLDYLVRDAHAVQLQISVNAERVMRHCYLFEVLGKYHLCYDKSVQFEVLQIFQGRYALHKTLYGHPKTIAVDENAQEIMLLAHKLGLIDFIAAVRALERPGPDYFDLYDELDDNCPLLVQCLLTRFTPSADQLPLLEQLRNALRRYKTHTLFTSVYRAFVNAQFFEEPSANKIRQQLEADIADKDQFIAVREIHFGMHEQSPVELVAFKQQNKIIIPEKLRLRLSLTMEDIATNPNLKVVSQQLQELTTPNFFNEFAIFVYNRYRKQEVSPAKLEELAHNARVALQKLMVRRPHVEVPSEIEVMEQFYFDSKNSPGV